MNSIGMKFVLKPLFLSVQYHKNENMHIFPVNSFQIRASLSEILDAFLVLTPGAHYSSLVFPSLSDKCHAELEPRIQLPKG